MNENYTKAMLYAYPNLEAVAEQIDELVEKRALVSINDFSPALEQCEKIVELTFNKDLLFSLKIILEEILNSLTSIERDCLDYKYFKLKPKEYYIDFDAESRTYFRRQNKLIERISIKLEKKGYDNKWYEENYLKMDFFSELNKRVIEYEKSIKKRKKAHSLRIQNNCKVYKRNIA